MKVKKKGECHASTPTSRHSPGRAPSPCDNHSPKLAWQTRHKPCCRLAGRSPWSRLQVALPTGVPSCNPLWFTLLALSTVAKAFCSSSPKEQCNSSFGMVGRRYTSLIIIYILLFNSGGYGKNNCYTFVSQLAKIRFTSQKTMSCERQNYELDYLTLHFVYYSENLHTFVTEY